MTAEEMARRIEAAIRRLADAEIQLALECPSAAYEAGYRKSAMYGVLLMLRDGAVG